MPDQHHAKLQEFLPKLLDVTIDTCPEIKPPPVIRPVSSRDLCDRFLRAMELVNPNVAAFKTWRSGPEREPTATRAARRFPKILASIFPMLKQNKRKPGCWKVWWGIYLRSFRSQPSVSDVVRRLTSPSFEDSFCILHSTFYDCGSVLLTQSKYTSVSTKVVQKSVKA